MDSGPTESSGHRSARHREKSPAHRLRHAAVHAGFKVRYFTAADLIEVLYRGLADKHRRQDYRHTAARGPRHLGRDGFAPLDDTGTQLLFRLVAAGYERRSLAIASHWPSTGGRFLPEHTTAASILDRLLHHATSSSPPASPTGCVMPTTRKEPTRVSQSHRNGVGTSRGHQRGLLLGH